MDGVPEIQADRLLRRLDRFSEIGRDEHGGVTRLALSDEDRQGREQLTAWLQQAGLQVLVDDGGTVWGRTTRGVDPPILVGSHIDSVRNGGRYDGVLGVLAGLEAVAALAPHARHRLGVVAFTNEEGARFRPALLGSSLSVGALPPEKVYAIRDAAGLAFGDELRRIGYLGSRAARPDRATAFVELHIEQGPQLEEAGARIGVGTGIVGMRWYEATVAGAAGHAGATPMARRRDALQAAVAMIAALQAEVRAGAALCTVGRLQVEPNVPNVIPARVAFSIDVRSHDRAEIDRIGAYLQSNLPAIAAANGCTLELATIWDSPLIAFDQHVQAVIADSARDLSARTRNIWSGPSHDARMMATVAPTGMIFVPNAGGVSHSPEEYTAPEDCILGARVLMRAVERLDRS